MPKPVSLLAAALLCLLVPVLAVAEQIIYINEDNFPDDVFRGIVLEHYDTDKDGKLSQVEINQRDGIYVGRLGIKSLKGIEHFTALK